MNKDFIDKLYNSHTDCASCPSPEVVCEFFDQLVGTLFPDRSSAKFQSQSEFRLHIDGLKVKFEQILTKNKSNIKGNPHLIIEEFFDRLEEVYVLLKGDVTAIYEGDPAANGVHEVIRSYPGFYAIAAYRIAHLLYDLEISLIPRIITEHAHSKTGIDIHPGAEIGENFFIDHGTGVVIGETTIIGDNVKIYQGVTLGALSVSKEKRYSKRHPTIGDNVIIYSGATILGGETYIGKDSIIGGNVWLTESVPQKSKIYYRGENMSNKKALSIG